MTRGLETGKEGREKEKEGEGKEGEGEEGKGRGREEGEGVEKKREKRDMRVVSRVVVVLFGSGRSEFIAFKRK